MDQGPPQPGLGTSTPRLPPLRAHIEAPQVFTVTDSSWLAFLSTMRQKGPEGLFFVLVPSGDDPQSLPSPPEFRFRAFSSMRPGQCVECIWRNTLERLCGASLSRCARRLPAQEWADDARQLLEASQISTTVSGKNALTLTLSMVPDVRRLWTSLLRVGCHQAYGLPVNVEPHAAGFAARASGMERSIAFACR